MASVLLEAVAVVLVGLVSITVTEVVGLIRLQLFYFQITD